MFVCLAALGLSAVSWLVLLPTRRTDLPFKSATISFYFILATSGQYVLLSLTAILMLPAVYWLRLQFNERDFRSLMAHA